MALRHTAVRVLLRTALSLLTTLLESLSYKLGDDSSGKVVIVMLVVAACTSVLLQI